MEVGIIPNGSAYARLAGQCPQDNANHPCYIAMHTKPTMRD